MKLNPQDVANLLNYDFNYLSMDKDLAWYAYHEIPIVSKDLPLWQGTEETSGDFVVSGKILSIDFNGDWKDSLFQKQIKKEDECIHIFNPENITMCKWGIIGKCNKCDDIFDLIKLGRN